jgi:hypothetical protein
MVVAALTLVLNGALPALVANNLRTFSFDIDIKPNQ